MKHKELVPLSSISEAVLWLVHNFNLRRPRNESDYPNEHASLRPPERTDIKKLFHVIGSIGTKCQTHSSLGSTFEACVVWRNLEDFLDNLPST